MSLHRISYIAVVILLTASHGSAAEKTNEFNAAIVPTGSQARLVELSAKINVTNDSDTEVMKYIFRLTMPADDLTYQRARLAVDIADSAVKTHKNGIDKYLEMTMNTPGRKTVTRDVKFLVLLVPVEFFKVPKLLIDDDTQKTANDFLAPSALVESDSAEVKKVAESLFARSTTEIAKAKAAYEYPAKALKYRVQKPAGAVKALQTGVGDCTEFACLFVALARCGGIPARRAAVFNLGTKETIASEEPNHDIAEAFLPSHGWVPVDPNVGAGKYDRPVGFAKAGNAAILLKREPSFVWSTFLPPDGFAKGAAKPVIKPSVKWEAKTVSTGSPKKMIEAFER